MGMLIVTMMAGRLKIGHMTKILTLLGLTVIPQGVACMLSGGNWTRLMALVAFACIGDVICSCAKYHRRARNPNAHARCDAR